MAQTSSAAAVDVARLVQEADLGGRRPAGIAKRILSCTCIAWSLIQLWYASPLPFVFNFAVMNDSQMRSLHLAFSLFLAFVAYPFTRRSPRDRVPAAEWILGACAAFCAAYLFIFYRDLALRPGQPTTADFVVSIAGMLFLLEATRRVVGPPLAIIAILLLGFAFAGPWMPEALQHKGVSLSKAVSHYWLSTEGVFGVALGVSSSYIDRLLSSCASVQVGARILTRGGRAVCLERLLGWT